MKIFDWITYLSATSVYGDKKGQWVNEDTNPKPTSERGIARLKAENNWLKYFRLFNLPIQIFRLSGIYSIENLAFKTLRSSPFETTSAPKPNLFIRLRIFKLELDFTEKQIKGFIFLKFFLKLLILFFIVLYE